MTKQSISLIPYPLSLELTDGILSVNSAKAEIITSKDGYESILPQILKSAGFESKFSSKGSSNSLVIELHEAETFNNNSLENHEAYGIEVTKDKILVYSSSATGFFYAFQTLQQLLSSYKEIPCLKIYDKPEYEWRGFMLDTCRFFYSTDFIKKMLDACAFHKINHFHWHLTDDQGWRINIPEYPLLTRIGSKRWTHTLPDSFEGAYDGVYFEKTYYTDEQIKDIVKYAAERHITVVPEIELPGHASALLASYPEFGCTGGPYKVENRWGIFPDVLCLGNDDIFKIYDAIFSTIERLFPSQYLHIGGDECLPDRWEDCPKCQARLKELKLDKFSQLQSWATHKMVDLVVKHNKIPIGWDEVLDNTEKFPLPGSLVVQSWRGEEGGERAVKLDHQVIMSPQTHCYLNFKNYAKPEEPGRLGVTTVKKVYSYTPFTKNMSENSRKFVMGGECTLWTEALPYSKVAEYLLFPRFCAISESLWLPENKKDFERFSENLPLHKQRLESMDFLCYKGPLE